MKRIFLFWRVGRRDMRLLWFALRQPNRPAWLLPAVALLALFALEPANFALPLLGALDELVVLPMLLHALVTLLPRDVAAAFAGVDSATP